jgi:hypothetical protein
VAVSVALDAFAPVSVAALLNGSEIVKVFDAVRRSRLDELLEVQHASDVGHHRHGLRARLPALITATASFPLPSAATTHGRDHGHGQVHAHGHGMATTLHHRVFDRAF